MQSYDRRGDLRKHCEGRSFVVANLTQGGGAINHVTLAENERAMDSLEIRVQKRYEDALRKKNQWQRTEYPTDNLEIMYVD